LCSLKGGSHGSYGSPLNTSLDVGRVADKDSIKFISGLNTVVFSDCDNAIAYKGVKIVRI